MIAVVGDKVEVAEGQEGMQLTQLFLFLVSLLILAQEQVFFPERMLGMVIKVHYEASAKFEFL